MAHAKTVKTVEVTLTLDEDEAGYLLDMLSAHVAGSLINDHEPLGRIRNALKDANAVRKYAIKESAYGDRGYAVISRPDYVNPWKD